MSLRAVRVRNLLFLVAVFATIVVAGCWDNRRTLQRVLEDGYPAMVEITGAQTQRLAPFAFDGWRPRFVEQDLSVDLKWSGKDGTSHVFSKVPVTEDFARTIVSGDQVKLAILPAKVMDDPHAVPVFTADAAARSRSLQEWTRDSALVAVAAWMGFGVSAFWISRGATATRGQVPAAFPLRRVLFGFVALVLGTVLTFRAWSVEDLASGAGGGIETTAEITSASTVPAASGGESHVVRISWKDAQGGVHHVGPIPISDRYWSKITRDGVLVVHQARIRYGKAPDIPRPELIDDPAQSPWQLKAALAIGLVLMALGAGALFSAARSMR